MFLGQLSEKEKIAFLGLSIHVSKVNGVFTNEENELIQAYCQEMQIGEYNVDDITPMDEIIEVFKEAEIQVKKIVLLESLGLVYADGEFDDIEKNFIDEFANNIGLTSEDVKNQTNVILEYLSALKKVVEAIS